MLSAAWAALADCFARLSRRHRFTVRLPPNRSSAVALGKPIMFSSADPAVWRGAGRPVLDMCGQGGRDEFPAFNTLRCLSWAAGRLADSETARPDLFWLATVSREQPPLGHPQQLLVTVEDIGAAAAALARRYAEAPSPHRPIKPLTSGNWQVPFVVLRQEFHTRSLIPARWDLRLLSAPATERCHGRSRRSCRAVQAIAC